MRQGNDIGTQYRSGIYFGELNDLDMLEQAKQSQKHYDQLLAENKKPKSTTEVLSNIKFFYAEEYHQQYLAKNPQGYCPNHTCSATGLPLFA